MGCTTPDSSFLGRIASRSGHRPERHMVLPLPPISLRVSIPATSTSFDKSSGGRALGHEFSHLRNGFLRPIRPESIQKRRAITKGEHALSHSYWIKAITEKPGME